MTTLLERARQEGTPLIDDAGTGEDAQVTFVWEGDDPPMIAGEFNAWNAARETQFIESAPGVWKYAIRLPRDGYYEYLFTHDHDDPKSRLNDPLNKRCVTNGMGKFNNFFNMPAATHTNLVNVKKGVPQGTVSHHIIEHNFLVDKKRDLWLYTPPTDQPVPLILVYDGRDYLKRARLPHIIDNLIAQNKIEPVALAMIENGKRGRIFEYVTSEATLVLVTQLVFPLAQEHLNLIDVEASAGSWGVLGASLGGLMALYTGLRLPTVFGKVISQSGSFQLDFGTGNSISEVLLRLLPAPPLKIWQDVGQFEWLLETNRKMNALLNEKGYNVTYREYPGGHNYTSWRDMLPDALMATFGKTTDS